jgi:CubicO group peptidase (beta-lactamase class C family)
MNTLQTAIDFAIAHEIDWARDPAADSAHWGIHLNDPPPWNVLRGPVHARGPASGVVMQGRTTLAEWGEPDRADLTFSIAKTYLALLAGIAHDRGLMPDPDEPVRMRVPGIGFDDAHNAPITWAQLLLQTSEWEGRCFGLPEQVDRYRTVIYGGEPAQGAKGDPRPLRAPGTFWEYNDVRINQLSLALLHLFGAPLPEVFEAAVMKPLGCTSAWRWVGYDDAWTDITDRQSGKIRRVQSVPGGTHWGGGVSISARDQARIARMVLDGGLHQDAQGQTHRILSQAWIERMHQPCPIAPFYGMLTWLNDGPKQVYPAASRRSSFMIGAGGQCAWMDPERDLVVVSRWLAPEHTNDFFKRLLDALG